MKTIQTLLKNGADPLLKDSHGNTAAAVATADEIKALLMKAERKKQKKLAWRASELPENLEDDDDDDMEDDVSLKNTNLVRINSKTVWV